MNNITYEQFEGWCKHWNYTTDEGFRAMCFVANIIGQNYGNCLEDAKKVVEQIKAVFANVEIQLQNLSPVFVAQGGPSCIAIQYIER